MFNRVRPFNFFCRFFPLFLNRMAANVTSQRPDTSPNAIGVAPFSKMLPSAAAATTSSVTLQQYTPTAADAAYTAAVNLVSAYAAVNFPCDVAVDVSLDDEQQAEVAAVGRRAAGQSGEGGSAATQSSTVSSVTGLMDTREFSALWPSLQQNKARTVHAVLFLCLNVGNDVPDAPRIEPCAKLECWLDPVVAQNKAFSKGSEAIAEALEGQYRALHKEILYRRCLESSVDEARTALQKTRQKAKGDSRVLVHYNGHGMPRVTANGDLWFFDRERTHYFPIHISELAGHADSPTVYVFDCCNAGAIANNWHTFCAKERPRDILLCACGDAEDLPMNPLLPYDIFTACLTTPLRVTLEWYIHYAHRRVLLPGVTADLVRNIPGDPMIRKTPLGELTWILTAITDTIAWCTFPPAQFYSFFRQDMMLKVLLRNFLLADKIMREMGVSPVMYPPMPCLAHLHPLWHSWDVALEGVLAQLPALKSDPSAVYQPSSFFHDQLTAFEVWLEVGDLSQHPEHLPTVVLALTQTSLRVHALLLIARYFELGVQAVQKGFACGALPYLIKNANQMDTLPISIVAWLLILRVEPAVACAELIRAQADLPLLRLLMIEHHQPIGSAQPTPINASSSAIQSSETSSTVPLMRTTQLGGAAAGAQPSTVAGWGQLTPPSGCPPLQVIRDLSTALDGDATGLGVVFASTHSQGTSVGALPISSPVSGSAAAFPTAALGGGGIRSSALGGNTTTSTTSLMGGGTTGGASPLALLLPTIFYVAPQTPTLADVQCAALALLSALLERGGEKFALLAWNRGLFHAVSHLLSAPHASLRSWACLTLAAAIRHLPSAKYVLATEYTRRRALFHPLLGDVSPVVRASCVVLLSSLLGDRLDYIRNAEDHDRRLDADRGILEQLLPHFDAVSTAVRLEIVNAAAAVLRAYPVAAAAVLRPVTGSEADAEPLGETEFMLTPASSEGASVVSRLSAADPTDNAAFRKHPQAVDVPTLAGPLPPHVPSDAALHNPKWGDLPASTASMLHCMVQDSATLLARALVGTDPLVKQEATDVLHGFFSRGAATGERPPQRRVDRECKRFTGELITQRSDAASEVARHRLRRNMDLAHQACLISFSRPQPPFSISSAAASMSGLGSDSGAAASPPGGGMSPGGVGSFANGGGGGRSAGTPPPVGAPLPPPGSPNSSSGNLAAVAATSSSPISPFQVHQIPFLHEAHGDQVPHIAVFRLLEPQVVSCDRNGRCAITSFETPQRPTLVRTFTGAPQSSALRVAHVVNDASETPLLLLATASCDFFLLKNAFLPPFNLGVDEDSTGLFRSSRRGHDEDDPTASNHIDTVLSFQLNASGAALRICGSSPLVNGKALLVSEYRPSDGTVFAWAPGLPSNAVVGISLVEEHISHRLAVPGDVPVTALVHDNKSVFVGCDDGTVRYFDERKKNSLTLVSVLDDRSQAAVSSSAALSYDASICDLGISSLAQHQVFVSSAGCVRIFDTRTRKMLRRVEAPSLPFASLSASLAPTAVATTSSLDSMSSRRLLSGLQQAPIASASPVASAVSFPVRPPALTRVSVAKHAPLFAYLTADGALDICNLRLESFSPRSIRRTGGLAQSGAPAFALHAMKPVLVVGQELVILTDHVSKLGTAFAL